MFALFLQLPLSPCCLNFMFLSFFVPRVQSFNLIQIQSFVQFKFSICIVSKNLNPHVFLIPYRYESNLTLATFCMLPAYLFQD